MKSRARADRVSESGEGGRGEVKTEEWRMEKEGCVRVIEKGGGVEAMDRSHGARPLSVPSVGCRHRRRRQEGRQ